MARLNTQYIIMKEERKSNFVMGEKVGRRNLVYREGSYYWISSIFVGPVFRRVKE